MNEHTRIITGEDGGYITAPSLPAYTLYETAKGSQPIPISAYAFENGELYITGTIDDEMLKSFIIMLRIYNLFVILCVRAIAYNIQKNVHICIKFIISIL